MVSRASFSQYFSVSPSQQPANETSPQGTATSSTQAPLASQVSPPWQSPQEPPQPSSPQTLPSQTGTHSAVQALGALPSGSSLPSVPQL